MGSIIKPMLGRSGTKAPTNRGSKPWDMERDIPHDYRRRIGARIRELREQHGMTQAELAQRLGMLNTSVSAMELGRSTISPENYATLADVFGLDHAEWGQFLLKFTNPWLYALCYGADRQLQADLDALPRRIGR